jgi:hypothetical protein
MPADVRRSLGRLDDHCVGLFKGFDEEAPSGMGRTVMVRVLGERSPTILSTPRMPSGPGEDRKPWQWLGV